MNRITITGLLIGLAISTSAAGECVSCQIHKQGGAYLGSYQTPAYSYAPYYGGRYPGYRYPGYGHGSIRHRCGPDGNCTTTYRGPASDIQYLPRIDRQIRQTRPARIYIKPETSAVPHR